MTLTPASIVKWFGAPEFARVDLRNRARALWFVSWPFFVVITVLLASAALVEPETLIRRATTIAAVGSLITVLHMTSRAGRPVLASWILVIGLSVLVTQRAWVTGGVHAPVALFYALFIVMAGTLLGVRAAVITATVCILGATALMVGTVLGRVSPRSGGGSAAGAFVFIVLAIAVALLLAGLVAFRARRQGLDVDAVQLLVEDMRSPMQVLILRLELLRAEVRGEFRRDAEVALDAVRALRRMTNTLLDVSRIDGGRMPVRRNITDVSTLAGAVVTAARLTAGCDIVLEVWGDSTCLCDPELTRRTFENLVANAVKVTPCDGRVRVVVAGSTDRVFIVVMDDGRAVPAKDRARIFEPFRVEGHERGFAAGELCGLGLAFCRLAVEAQGGTIRVEDGVPRGNAFVVELPR